MSESAPEAAKRLVKKNRLAYALLYPLIYLRKAILDRRSKALERAYETIFSRVEGGSVVVRIPQFRGSFEVDTRSHTLKRAVLWGHEPPERIEEVTRRIDPARDIIDVGANIGLYTVLFSKTLANGSRVLSVEPTPRGLGYLRRNIEINECADTVTVFEGAATDVSGTLQINIIPGMEQYSSLGRLVHPAIKDRRSESVEVIGETIDNLVKKFDLNPGFIKVDTEGAEYKVFTGATDTIATYRPVIWSELSDVMLSSFGHTSKMVVDLLEKLGYDVTDALKGTVIREPFDGEMLAVPRED